MAAMPPAATTMAAGVSSFPPAVTSLAPGTRADAAGRDDDGTWHQWVATGREAAGTRHQCNAPRPRNEGTSHRCDASGRGYEGPGHRCDAAVREGDTGIMEPCEASIEDLADYGATTVLKEKMPRHRAGAAASPGEAGRLHVGRRLVKDRPGSSRLNGGKRWDSGFGRERGAKVHT